MNKKRLVFILLLLAMVTPWRSSVAGVAGSAQAVQALAAYPAGVRFDPVSESWSFYGVVDQTARYEIPAVTIDLARVTFRSRWGEYRRVWVALGVSELPGKQAGYQPLGPWGSSNDALRSVWQTAVVRVSVSRHGAFLAPTVSAWGINWRDCRPEALCRYAADLDNMHMDFSNRFIASESAPGWYPWGFLFWTIEPLEVAP